MNEGAAVDADTRIRGIDLHAISHRQLARGELPSLDALARRFESLPSERSYVAAGSFVRFVRERHGVDVVRAIWDNGLPGLEAHLSVSVASLEEGWTTRIRTSSSR